jgi:nitrate reductase delta subunit
MMLRSRKKRPEHLVALDRVRDWTRERFKLPDDAAIMVSEVTCALPGCPPLETVVAFWTENDRRHHFKLFKPVTEVVPDDLPPSWMKNALVVVEGFGCECC